MVTDRVVQPALGVRGTLRWLWRQLTSMRTALVLLFLLALAAIPGSVFPQRGVAPIRVNQYLTAHPALGPLLDRLGVFDMYGTPWFAAIYLLLMISLAGCIVPRVAQHLRALRTPPPPAPRNLSRLPVYRSATTLGDAHTVLSQAEQQLRHSRFRVRVDASDGSISAEKGYVRETGNLVFHISLLLLLVGVGLGALYGYKGTVIVVQGDSFANTVTSYDDFHPGRRFNADQLPPFTFDLTHFSATYVTSGPRAGQPASFGATVSYTSQPGAQPAIDDIRVNHPLQVDGSHVYLLGHGYAPEFTVRDGAGNVVYRGSTVTLPQDGMFTSVGVVKTPDARPSQLGFNVRFTPTAPAVVNPATGPVSTFPALHDPRVYLGAWKGNLGMDTGTPQSVYVLDTSKMQQVGNESLAVGQTWELPNGLGSITFDGVRQWGNFQVSSDPGRQLVLIAALCAILGVIVSLRVPRRRIWVRARPDEAGRSLVEVAGLARSETAQLDDDVERVLTELVPDPAADVEGART